MLLSALQPSIYPLGIRIDEPVTTITDLLVSAVCFYAFFKLYSFKTNLRLHKFLIYYFLGMGIATFLGGVVGHGFIYLFDIRWEAPEGLINFLSKIFGEELFRDYANPLKLPGWITSMLAVALLERAAIEHATKAASRKSIIFFKWMNIIELLTFMTITFLTLNFKFVEIHSAYGIMFIVGSYSVFTYYKTKSQASKTFIFAVGVAIVSSIIYLSKFSIHLWFNYLDLSHVLMAFAAFIFYKGAIQMIEENSKRKVYN